MSDRANDATWKIGDLCRYSGGPTALVRLVNRHAGGWYGDHVLGCDKFVSEDNPSSMHQPTAEDHETWRRLRSDPDEGIDMSAENTGTELDPINHPRHYTGAHSGGMECIDLVRIMSFSGGNAIKYLWRAGLKGSKVEDLRKARWYVEDAAKNGEGESGAFAGQAVLHKNACLGFPALVASSMMHIIREDYDLALHSIDALIAEAEAATHG